MQQSAMPVRDSPPHAVQACWQRKWYDAIIDEEYPVITNPPQRKYKVIFEEGDDGTFYNQSAPTPGSKIEPLTAATEPQWAACGFKPGETVFVRDYKNYLGGGWHPVVLRKAVTAAASTYHTTGEDAGPLRFFVEANSSFGFWCRVEHIRKSPAGALSDASIMPPPPKGCGRNHHKPDCQCYNKRASEQPLASKTTDSSKRARTELHVAETEDISTPPTTSFFEPVVDLTLKACARCKAQKKGRKYCQRTCIRRVYWQRSGHRFINQRVLRLFAVENAETKKKESKEFSGVVEKWMPAGLDAATEFAMFHILHDDGECR